MNSHQRRKASRAALAYVGGVGATVRLPTGKTATVVGRCFSPHSVQVIREFTANTVEEISKYDPRAVELRSAGCISYSYLQRRLAPVALFRRDARGSSEALKAVLSAMEGEGMLRRLEKEEASELFNTSAVVYRINKGSF